MALSFAVDRWRYVTPFGRFAMCSIWLSCNHDNDIIAATLRKFEQRPHQHLKIRDSHNFSKLSSCRAEKRSAFRRILRGGHTYGQGGLQKKGCHIET